MGGFAGITFTYGGTANAHIPGYISGSAGAGYYATLGPGSNSVGAYTTITTSQVDGQNIGFGFGNGAGEQLGMYYGTADNIAEGSLSWSGMIGPFGLSISVPSGEGWAGSGIAISWGAGMFYAQQAGWTTVTPLFGKGSPFQKADHLIFDLTGDGIDLISVSDSHSFFDFTGNGIAVKTGWFGDNSAVLFHKKDTSSSGLQSDEIVGVKSGDAFADLGLLDQNADGILDNSDKEFSSLYLWRDSNGDGVYQDSERHSLNEAGVQSISVAHATSNEVNAGNQVYATGSFVRTNGTIGVSKAVDFAIDPINTNIAPPSNFELTNQSTILPAMYGYGKVRDFTFATSIDKSLADDALILISNFGKVSSSIFDRSFEDLVSKWAGVSLDEATSPQSTAEQHQKIVEAFFGQTYADVNGSNDINASTQKRIEGFYQSIIDNYKARFVSQAATTKFLQGANPDDLGTNLASVLSAATVNFETDRINADFKFITQEIIKHTKGGLTSRLEDFDSVRSALQSLYRDLLSDGAIQSNAFEEALASTDLDTFTKAAFIDAFGSDNFTQAGGQYIESGAETKDFIEIGATSLAVGAGAGDDVYLYGRSSGNVTISEFNNGGSADKLLLSEINFDDVSLERDGDDVILRVRSADGPVDGTIRLVDQLEIGNGKGVDKIIFQDGTSWSANDLRRFIIDKASTQNDDVISGFGSDDNIDGGDGNDTISAGEGNDIISGGRGDDILHGGLGDDTYLYNRGDGNDTIDDSSWRGGADKLVLTSIEPNSISLERNEDTVTVIIAPSTQDGTDGGRIALIGQFSGDFSSGIEQIIFDDGTIWSADDLRRMIVAQSATDRDDIITGSYLAETIDGGKGNDTLSGGGGNDTYLYKSGDGNDRIVEHWRYYEDKQTNTLKLVDLNPGQISLAASGNDLIVTDTTTGQTITIEGHYGDNDGIQAIAFADGTTWDRAEITARTIAPGTAGNDSLTGFNSNDVLDGGKGDDVLAGGYGNDTYVYRSGDGNDRIVDHWRYYEEQQTNTLKLVDLKPGQISLASVGSDLLITDTTTGQIITVEGGRGTSDGIQVIAFADGTTWDRTQINAQTAARGTAGNDSLSGSDQNDVFDGGRGDDVLAGGFGNDTYLYKSGDGNDRIVEHWHWYEDKQTNTLKLTDLNPGQVSLASSGNDLLVTDTVTGQTITVEGHYGDYDGIQAIAFADGTTWDRTQIAAHSSIPGTAGSDNLTGTSGADVIQGGKGDDVLTGGFGDDTYLYKSGDGDDRIVEHWGSGDPAQINTLKLTDLNPNQVSLIPSGGRDLLVRDTTAGQTITVEGGLGTRDGIQAIVFADGTAWDRTQIIAQTAARGTAGNDSLIGSDQNDVLDGGKGDDTLAGGGGNDTYLYKSGDGNDRIVEHWRYYEDKQTNTLKLVDLNPGQISLASSGNDLIVSDTTTGQTITVEGHYGDNDGIQAIAFADGTAWDRTQIAAHSAAGGTAGNDSLTGFNTNDVLDGGKGDDVLAGGYGNDTYVYRSGDGNDRIVDHWRYYEEQQTNTLKLVDLKPGQISLASVGSDLLITDTTTGQIITVEGGRGASDGVQVIAFADGTTWDRTQINAQTAARGTAGNDSLSGSDQNDVFDGGRGDDVLAGGYGNDTYLYKSGDGNDRIVEHWRYYEDKQTNTLKLTDLNPGQVSLASSGNDLIVTDTTTGQTITVEGHYGDNDGIQAIAFADGTTWDRTQIAAHSSIPGTAGSDTLTGTSGADVIQGGKGDDVLTGGFGDDTYLYKSGDGNDRIVEHWGSGDPAQTNTLKLTDLNPNQISLTSVGNDLLVTDTTTGQTITVESGLGARDGIQAIVFADGTAWDRTQIAAKTPIQGTSDDDNLTGTNHADILIGGRGNDVLTGGGGADTFIFGPASGKDVIADFQATGTDHDLIQFDHSVFADASSALAASSQVGSDVVITISAQDSVVLKDTQLNSLSTSDFRIA